MEGSEKRNYYVDFIRGLAIISVILIHTAWHSGTKYVPEIVRNMTLLFEVPIFFFIAGWTYSYSKSIKKYVRGIFKLYIKYIIYISIVFLLLIMLTNNKYQITDLLNWIFHKYSSTSPLSSVQYSLWFMKTYFMSVFVSLSIINLCKWKQLKKVLIILLILIFIQTFNTKFFSSIIIGLNVSINYIIFYSFLFILGYVLRNYKIGNIKFIIFIIINIFLLLILKYIFKFDIFNIQQNKYSLNIVYLIWSAFGIIVVVYLKKYFENMKENVICKLGKSSIYLYFAQGISSSLLYFLVPYINLKWYFKLPILFVINFLVAVIVMKILKFVIENIIRLPEYKAKIRGKINENK